jgi:MSHA biogenesis protein MshM
MYLDFFRLERHPFRITPDPSLFYAGGTHGRGVVLDALVYGITTGEGILKVVGEVGSGKTMLCRMLEERLPASVEIVYLANPNLSARDIIYAIAFELRLDVEASTDRLVVMHKLQDYLLARHAEGATVVVFIEEAQSMPLDTLEEVRLLSNLETHRHKLMQIVLFGQPELDRKLAEKSIRQLKERITHSFYLDPLNEDEIREYLHFRLQTAGCPWPQLFHPKAEKLLGKASGGLTRRINILADKALLASYADPATRPELRNSAGEIQPMVQPGHVRIAIADCGYGNSWWPRMPEWFRYGAAVLTGTVLTGGLILAWQQWGGDSPAVATQQQVAPSGNAETAASTASGGGNAGQPVTSAASLSERPVASVANSPRRDAPDTDPAVQPRMVTSVDNPTTAETAARALVESLQAPAEPAVNSDRSESSQAMDAQASADTRPEAAGEGIATALADPAGEAVQMATVSRDMPEPTIETPPSTPVATPQPDISDTRAVSTAVARPVPVETKPAPSTSSPVVPPLATLMLERSSQWQESLVSKSGYSIQMISIPVTETFTLQEYLEFLELSGMLEQTWLCLISGNSSRKEQWLVFHSEFDGLSSARDFINGLPPYLGQHSPYARNLGDIACAD